ncbi:hypothetical protein [Haliangium sp.]|uniref:hypothetical protein n=1 Tax=Haliangium sp. TaxID=2663208 RepID=UPI003D0EF11D
MERTVVTREQIEPLLARVFLHRWDYTEGDRAYFANKESAVRAFAQGLGTVLEVAPRVEVPMNLQNYYSIEACLDRKVDQLRHAIAYELVEARGEVCYLKVLCSVILPACEARWHRYTIRGGEFVHEKYALLDDEWLSRQARFEHVVTELLHLGEEHRLTVLDPVVLQASVDSSWPVPFPGNEQPTLRDFIFPGVID